MVQHMAVASLTAGEDALTVCVKACVRHRHRHSEKSQIEQERATGRGVSE